MKSQKRHNPLPPSTFLRPDSAQAAQGRHSKSKIQNPKPTLGNKGFTLIEIAVVLVILGIVFMSVLKVESMVRNAKIRQVINQYRELRTAIMVYRDKYGYLPGDDPYATTHVGATYNGNGDQYLDLAEITSRREYALLFDHLSRAGLIKGNFIGTTHGNYPLTTPRMYHAFKNSIFGTMVAIVEVYTGATEIGTGTVNTGTSRAGNCVRIDNIPPDAAQAIDIILDDGNSSTGSVRGSQINRTSGLDRLPHNYTATDGSHDLSIVIFFE